MVHLLHALLAPADAATLDVGPQAPYPTVQEAIDAAAPGDTVVVAAGFYDAPVVFDKDLTVRGSGIDATFFGPAGKKLYHGGTAVVNVMRGVHAQLEDLTLDAAGLGGVVVVAGELDAARVRVTHGRERLWGGVGVRPSAEGVRFTDCRFEDNLAEGTNATGSAKGAAIHVNGESTVEVARSLFCGNRVTAVPTTEDGFATGGVIQTQWDLTVTESVFVANHAPEGSAISAISSDLVGWVNDMVIRPDNHVDVRNNTFWKNTSDSDILHVLADTAVVHNNLFAHNERVADTGAEVVLLGLAGPVGSSGTLFHANLGYGDALLAPATEPFLVGDPVLSWAPEDVDCGAIRREDFVPFPGSAAIGAGGADGVFSDIGAVPFVDGDADGWPVGPDCDDGDSSVHPGAEEQPCNGLDDDCDPATEEGACVDPGDGASGGAEEEQAGCRCASGRPRGLGAWGVLLRRR